MNKRQVFIRTLKAVVLIIAVLVALPIYVQDACASYDVGNFSGGFAQGTTGGELWHTVTISHSGELVLNFTCTAQSGGTVSLWKPDKSGYIDWIGIFAKSLTFDHLAPGTYYIQVKQSSGGYGTYTVQAAFTPDVSAPGLQDEIVCLRILSGIPVSSSEIITDISKDGRIGMEECIYILQAVAGLRP